MPSITTRDGAKLHYLSIGRGAPVILLHGFAMQGAMWLPFIAPLAMRFRFILPYLRGFGGSHDVPLSQPCLLHSNNYSPSTSSVHTDRRSLTLARH